MVFLFAGRVGSHFSGSTWTFPAAMAYSTLGISALAYNSFGLDAEGIQFYFLAPVRLSTIVLAKNLFSFAIVGAEFLLVYGVLAIVASRPTLPVALATLAWLILAALVNVTVGNMRSVIAPKKMDPSKLSRKQTSQLSALMSILLMLVAGAVGAGVMFLGISLELPWLPVVVLAALAVGAAALYRAGLTGLDALASKHQETMIEELCKAS
jgi:ABC-2 type transport system permease protein